MSCASFPAAITITTPASDRALIALPYGLTAGFAIGFLHPPIDMLTALRFKPLFF